MDAVVARALESEHPRITLSYLEGNQQAARFYTRHGFVETHRETPGSGLPESVWMVREPGHGGAGMNGRPDAAAVEAARNLEEMKRMREIEEEILARAPENDIGPSLDRIRAVMEPRRRPAAHLPDDPPHRHERQDVDEPHDRLDPARDRAVHRTLHVAAPARHP